MMIDSINSQPSEIINLLIIIKTTLTWIYESTLRSVMWQDAQHLH